MITIDAMTAANRLITIIAATIFPAEPLSWFPLSTVYRVIVKASIVASGIFEKEISS